jgi:ABC-type Mn2+/Zn2+ transport system ATPase subunit
MYPVVLKDVEFGYNGEEVLKDITFKIDEGEFVAVMGPNGSGKTTLLKLILGLLKPKKGKIAVFGVDPSRDKDKIQNFIGFMPQKEHISSKFPILVKDVVLLGRLARKGIVSTINEEDMERAKEALKAVGLEDLWEKRFNELSEGQKQRVLLARALAVEPRILLLDEPFNGVDIPSQNKIIELMEDLTKKGTTVIMVVHNINPLLHHIHKVILLNRRLIAFGEVSEVLKAEKMIETYGASIPIIVCEEGFAHPLFGDTHG